MKDSNMIFNNNDNEFLSLAYGSQYDIAIIRKFEINDTSIISLKKDNFTALVFTAMLVY